LKIFKSVYREGKTMEKYEFIAAVAAISELLYFARHKE
jgi:hypothetical protein